MKPSDYSDADIKCAINSIKHDHDTEAARNLIEYFHACLDRGLPFNERLLHEYLRHAFGLITRGKSADTAFGLKRGQGRPSRNLGSRDIMLAAFVFKRIRELKAERGRDQNWSDAIGEAANKYFPDGEGSKAVEDAYAKYHHILEQFPEGERDVMLAAILEE